MEETIINLIFQALETMSSQNPDASWVGLVLTAMLSVCGIAAVATMWMPVPSQTTGFYAVFYRIVHGLAAHFSQNKGAKADGNSCEVKQAVKAVTGK
jgi:hypothetical protein